MNTVRISTKIWKTQENTKQTEVTELITRTEIYEAKEMMNDLKNRVVIFTNVKQPKGKKKHLKD